MLSLNLLKYMGSHFLYTAQVLLFHTVSYQGEFNMVRKGPWGTASPDCPCPAPGLPPLAHGPGPHIKPQGHHPLPHWHCSGADLQLPTALLCLATGPTGLGFPMGPHRVLALAHFVPREVPNAQGWECSGCPTPGCDGGMGPGCQALTWPTQRYTVPHLCSNTLTLLLLEALPTFWIIAHDFVILEMGNNELYNLMPIGFAVFMLYQFIVLWKITFNSSHMLN